MFTPISAGTTETDSEAKFGPLFKDMNMKITTMVEGNVPIIPPTFVPNFSAITVIKITIIVDKIKGKRI